MPASDSALLSNRDPLILKLERGADPTDDGRHLLQGRSSNGRSTQS
ncbi:hypothetical protein H0176_14030 [Methylorubrum populi]|jgi:hypothetical protein|uniref:Uncharacterized protein n=1 Tax=Methylorubrum rhodesianum TaxID=29427 RepID=A0ABU9Z5C4_9HYPH|nr:hypothetical protein [Methylorubrum rhodesianum]MBK3402087.1 hypothetical protein [Methylorubrum rhodesianum]MBY0141389.1 hypothetical protein [Methylorubrum populi]